MHSKNEGARGAAAPRQFSGRGVAYWTDGKRGAHLLRHDRLSAHRARCEDRRPRADFGEDGIVDLKQDSIRTWISITGAVGLHATPLVASDVIIVGAAHRDRRATRRARPT